MVFHVNYPPNTHVYWKYYREATRDNHSDTVHSQLKVFLPAETTLSYSGPKCSRKHLNQETFKGKIYLLASQFVATGGGFVQDISLMEAKLAEM